MIFSWNEKYLLELEVGSFKQTFKIPQNAVKGPEEVANWVDEEFIEEALDRFRAMMASMKKSMSKTQKV